MKKVLFIAVLVFITANAFAQFSKAAPDRKFVIIGKNKPMDVLENQLDYTILEKDTIYTFSYRDKTYQTLDEYETVSFSGTTETLKELYKALSSALDSDKESKNNFNLGAHIIRVTTMGTIGDKIIYLFVDKEGGGSAFTTLTKRELNKLFAIEDAPEKQAPETTN